MKKYLIIFFSILSYLSCYSQQFEWFKTLTFSGQNNYYYNPSSSICNFGENIALVSMTCAKNVINKETSKEIIKGNSKGPEPYFIIFDKNGEIINHKSIFLTNGINSFRNIFYNKNNGLTYFAFTTTSDSVSFDYAKTWLKLNKSNTNSSTCLIAIYDNNLDYIYSFIFSSIKQVSIGDIIVDKNGNIYCIGYFDKYLKINDELIISSQSEFNEHFILKINTNNKIEWFNNLGYLMGFSISLNENFNSIYTTLESYNIDNFIFFNNKIDSLYIPATNNPQTILMEFDTETGFLKNQSKFSYIGNNGLLVIQVKSNKNTILLNCRLGGNGNKKFVFDNDTSEFNVSNGRMFIIGFDALTLKKKFINFFGNTELSSYNFHLITEIYNDSLYSIKGLTNGNFNFSFNGQNNYSEDYLKTRPSDFASDYFATYTTSNQLKDVWYLTEHPYNQYPGFEGHPYIFEKDGDIYISGNIKYYASLGLGKREFNYSTYIDRSLTLVKYNCKPTAYFKYKNENDSVLFKNVSTGFCSYKWDFGDGTSTTQKSPYHKFASKTQSYKVSLITTNSCGSDTFYRYYSFSAGLTSFKYNSQIKIYPNPIRGNTIKIEMPENTEIKSVKIYSPTGQQLDECSFDKTEKTNYTATIGSKLSKGIYYVKIILDDNTGYVTKVIIGE